MYFCNPGLPRGRAIFLGYCGQLICNTYVVRPGSNLCGPLRPEAGLHLYDSVGPPHLEEELFGSRDRDSLAEAKSDIVVKSIDKSTNMDVEHKKLMLSNNA
ncbi:Uncharacterized protein Fot_08486 [Forsythia ovata]|uniref:Uncharacterized protein n=1 Tax=Forsythia ovata TaxID=205694 RepID=A0ABD1WZ95_9LAMI